MTVQSGVQGRATALPQAGTINWRVVVLASLGAGLEFYDFIIYGIFAQYIAATFFPSDDRLVSLISAFAVFAIGYLSRPLGGLVFSHVGDRAGRRRSFMASLLIMTGVTLAMAAVPGYAAIGLAAPVIFTALRFVQGLCVGGEMPGALTYVVETAPRRAGLACGIVIFCANTGVFLGTSISALLHGVLAPAAMEDYGWRIAFAVGGLLGAISVLLRRALAETPAFRAMQQRPARLPALEIFRRFPGPLLVGIGMAALVQAYNGLVMVALTPYLSRVAGYDPATASFAVNVAVGLLSIAILAIGWAGDAVPRRWLHRIGAAAIALGAYPAYQAMIGHSVDIMLLLAAVGLVGAFANGTFGALLTDLFPTEVRFSGVALAYNIAAAIFAGLSALVTTWLLSASGDQASPGLYLAAVAAFAFLAGLFHRRYAVRLA
ncbi:MHS family MFS transporter [Mycobacterium sp. KBS0706]|uniref:MFS transporter n=1 Tax=Mycobacterium sp. KBS0706 TaxID=2578109 RepID=UPI00110FB0E6|nr:MFS transporter [Mycobacterium sp. KBS0706]TSD90496.1 MHS family MFS transporter [Mycobacterium sp. KBS0706]